MRSLSPVRAPSSRLVGKHTPASVARLASQSRMSFRLGGNVQLPDPALHPGAHAPTRTAAVDWAAGSIGARRAVSRCRVQELLGQRGMHVPYSTLERFVWRLGVKLRGRRGDTVRMAPTPPGEVAEMDFERLGLLRNRETGRGQWIWGLSITLTYSRHSFLWPLVHQTVEATIEGLERVWAFFQGCPKRLVLDNFSAAVAGTDPLTPRPTRAFMEYSQARGFLVDPARVRKPKDKACASNCSLFHWIERRVLASQWCVEP